MKPVSETGFMTPPFYALPGCLSSRFFPSSLALRPTNAVIRSSPGEDASSARCAFCLNLLQDTRQLRHEKRTIDSERDSSVFKDRRMSHTMREVAKKAGVSPATVSRVLNKNTRYISPETAKRVLEVVDQLNYFKNVNARRLATGRSDLFGLVISEIANPYFPEIIRGFQETAWERGFDVLLFNTEYNPERTKAVIRKLVERDVRGVAILTSSVDRKATAELTAAGVGLVFSNLGPAGKLVSNVSIDYQRGISQAIEHVVALGHRSAAVIAGPESNYTAVIIKRALLAGLSERKLNLLPVIESNYRVDAGASAMRALLSLREMPTVIFCGSDLIAMGAMNALEEAGLGVPQDVSVIGIDDISFAFLARPPLTTIRVPREQLGVLAFQALDKMMILKRPKGKDYYIETELVVRRSTGPVRQHERPRARQHAEP
jgi:DNA-binding LacI/PurR family transcriptional regulator